MSYCNTRYKREGHTESHSKLLAELKLKREVVAVVVGLIQVR